MRTGPIGPSDRRAPMGLRHGDGKPQRLGFNQGDRHRAPRVRGLGERLVSWVVPWFQRRTREVGALLPQLSRHGLTLGDCDLARRGLWGGRGPPLIGLHVPSEGPLAVRI
jgi:hypothetical protein